MRITNLETFNYKILSGKREFDFNNGITGITGGNGRGKSTLMSAVAYALYGPEVITTGTADAVSWGEDKMLVGLFFDIENDSYIVTRSQDGKGTSKATLYKAPDGNPIASGPNAVNAEIEKLLGIDRVAFLISVFSRQEDLLGIGSLQPAKRMSTILRLLGLDRIDEAIKDLSEQRREKQRGLEAIRFSTQKEPESVSSLNTQYRSAMKTLTALQDERLAKSTMEKELEGRLSSLEEDNKKWLLYKSEVDNYTYRIEAINDQLKDARNFKQPIAPIAPAKLLDIKRYEADRDAYDLRVSQLERSKNMAVCPTCKRPFSEDENLYHLEQEERELVEIQVMLKQKFERYVESSAYEKRLSNYREVQLPAWRADVERIGNIQKQLKEADKHLSTLPKVKDLTKDVVTCQKQLEQARLEVATLAGVIASASGDVKHLEYRLEIAKEAAGDAERAKVLEIESLALSITIAEMKDFKSRQISRVIPTISDTASTFISDLTDGKYTELLLTPEYDIQYRNEQGDLKSFANLSGGERKSFALALRLSIADLRASKIGVLVLDEVFESLDTDRQESAWTVLEKLSSRYNQVFTVSHVDRLKDRSPSTISL